jgi:uncharacterized protein
MKNPIPEEALDDRLGFTGVSGSGKTYSAGTVVERVLERRGRVIIIDPLGVWYGLRLLTDGKTPSRMAWSFSAACTATCRLRSMPAH